MAVTLHLSRSLLEMEAAIQEATNAVGCCATEEALKRFDTDGSPMRVGPLKLTACGRDPKPYQTPYGVVEVERHVYQTSRGGHIDCPLEQQARIARRQAVVRQPDQSQVRGAQRMLRAEGPCAEPCSRGGHLLYPARGRVLRDRGP